VSRAKAVCERSLVTPVVRADCRHCSVVVSLQRPAGEVGTTIGDHAAIEQMLRLAEIAAVHGRLVAARQFGKIIVAR